MRENLISIVNSMAYALSLVLLLSTFLKRSRTRYIVAYLIILAADLWFAHTVKFQSTILLIPVSAAAFWTRPDGKEKIVRHIYKCMTAVYIIWIMTMLFASPFMILTPNFHNGTAYNLLLAAMIPLCAAILKRKRKRTISLFLLEYGAGYSIAIELVALLFFNLLMPFIGIQDIRIMGMVLLSISVVLLSVSMLHNRLTTEAVKARELAATNKQAAEYCSQIQDKYEAVMTVMHYLPKLYATLQTYIQKGDYGGLQAYFTKHVSPVFDGCILERYSLENIEDEQLRNLVQITFGQIGMTMNQIMPELRIDGTIRVPEKLSILVFETVSNLIDNALKHLKDQRQGYFKLAFAADDKSLIISVTNSLADNKSINELYNGRKKQTGRGLGLRRVRQIAIGTPEMELYTYKRGQFEGMPLLTQEIKIRLGDRDDE